LSVHEQLGVGHEKVADSSPVTCRDVPQADGHVALAHPTAGLADGQTRSKELAAQRSTLRTAEVEGTHVVARDQPKPRLIPPLRVTRHCVTSGSIRVDLSECK
jgi:hypothetical protein